ncbi:MULTISPECIES: hypothetical protein [unclassified Variovorax]|uniref:hypothetical protein n=1 Tax=unclassified Variovorax TaxID=663243 RepID=UPI0025782A49|nr:MULTISPECIES: hypothetical protein [unclassified Variovorax]MDM0086651.1 hypothetical protein [Variovorax sp. J22G40]MDM0145093.1 hypothetical protein [Variovorax sp. J2P1-31]
MHSIPETEWVATCAHRLQRHWRSVDPLELEALAAELAHDERLRAMLPTLAASEWLKPIEPIEPA